MNLQEADADPTSIVSFQNLTVDVETRSESFGAAPEISIESTTASIDAPKVISIPCRAPRVAVKTYVFPEAPEWATAPPAKKQSPDNPPATEAANAEADDEKKAPPSKRKATRIKPPSDVIKLQDRLYYLLQPSLESLVSAGSLDFPFEPFPYQFEGIAFLFPRHAAVLADEMGLGKTMQAISTIRMLIRSGEARNILLVCPKPLVTNWKREFALWAPEIPVSIIEGDQARRTWQWQTAEAPVRIANYELLMRDQQIVNDESLRYDLVVLDEAQRIKNSGSTTAQIVKAIPRDRSWALT
ncbi:MAG: SNF2-related protein, partial [Blastopirellula sp. JB062]